MREIAAAPHCRMFLTTRMDRFRASKVPMVESLVEVYGERLSVLRSYIGLARASPRASLRNKVTRDIPHPLSPDTARSAPCGAP